MRKNTCKSVQQEVLKTKAPNTKSFEESPLLGFRVGGVLTLCELVFFARAVVLLCSRKMFVWLCAISVFGFRVRTCKSIQQELPKPQQSKNKSPSEVGKL